MRSFEEVVKHLVDIHIEPMVTFLSSKEYHDEPMDVLEFCLSAVEDDEYIKYVQEQLSDKEFSAYGFEKIKKEVEEKIKYTFLRLTED